MSRSDPLVVMRAELLQMIEELEQLYAALPDVNARVPSRHRKTLGQLRSKVVRMRSPTAGRRLWSSVRWLLRVAAEELLKAWIGTLIYLLTALCAQLREYDCRKLHQIAARFGGATATRPRQARRHFCVAVVPY